MELDSRLLPSQQRTNKRKRTYESTDSPIGCTHSLSAKKVFRGNTTNVYAARGLPSDAHATF